MSCATSVSKLVVDQLKEMFAPSHRVCFAGKNSNSLLCYGKEYSTSKLCSVPNPAPTQASSLESQDDSMPSDSTVFVLTALTDQVGNAPPFLPYTACARNMQFQSIPAEACFFSSYRRL